MNVGGISSYAKDGVNALYFKENDIEHVVTKCIEMLQNPNIFRKFQDACLDTDIEQFNPYTYAERLLNKINYDGE